MFLSCSSNKSILGTLLWRLNHDPAGINRAVFSLFPHIWKATHIYIHCKHIKLLWETPWDGSVQPAAAPAHSCLPCEGEELRSELHFPSRFNFLVGFQWKFPQLAASAKEMRRNFAKS